MITNPEVNPPVILVIDDSVTMRKFLQLMLKKDFMVVETESAAEGLEWLYFNEMPDLVILDLNMKGMSGYEFLKRVQADQNLKSLEVLVLSGEKKSEERIKCLELGAKDYVIKPFNPKELYLRIKKMVSVFRSSKLSDTSNERGLKQD